MDIWIDFPKIIFLFLAALGVVAAFNLILQRNPIYSALSLIVTLCVMAALFVLLSAPFIAAMQIIVYAGAIMVLFVFVIMLLNVRSEEARRDPLKYLKWLAVPLFLALAGEVFFVVRSVADPTGAALPADSNNPAQVLGSAETIGREMFTSYLLPFEATSVLILMAIVGAMVLAKKITREDYERADALKEEAVALQPPISEGERQLLGEEVPAAHG